MASLADRITKPEDDSVNDASSSAAQPPPTENPEPTSWADEASSAAEASSASTNVKGDAEKDTSGLAESQTDGAGAPNGGAKGVVEPSYDVNIKLADLQADPNDPLYSAKSFEQLGL